MLKPADVNAELKLRFSVDRGKSMRLVENVAMTWGDLVERLSKPYVDKLTLEQFKDLPKDKQNTRKASNGYFIGGQMKRGVRDKMNGQDRQLLTFDIDQGTPEVLKALREGTTGLGKCEYYVHSTRSHGGDAIKLRIIIPLAKLLPRENYQAASRVGAWCIDHHMVAVDQVSFVPGQIMYWPAHCADVKPVGFHHKGRILDVAEMLDEWAGGDGWKDISMLPLSPRERSRLRENSEKIAQNPLEKRGIVGAFCNNYDVHQAIDTFLPEIYEPSEYGPDGVPTRYSFIGGTSSNGVVVLDGGLHIRSYHGSDPASGLNLNAYDLTRIHKYGELDIAKEKEIEDPRQFKSYKAMEQMLLEDRDVMAALRDSNYGMSDEDVDNSFDADEPVSPKSEVTSKIRDPFDGLPGTAEVETAVAAAENDDSLTDSDWRDSLDVNEKGTIKPTLRNILLILRNAATFKGRFGYNVFTHADCLTRPLRSKSLKIDFRIPAGKAYQPIEDIHVVAVHHVLNAPRGAKKTGWGLNVPQRFLEQAVTTVCRENSFHPVRDYLDSLEWDGKSRIDTLWTKLCHTPDTAYYRATSRNFLTAAVARIYSPGTKFDFMPVMIGLTGIRKSTAVRVLGSPAWSTESEGHFDNKQKFVEASLGFWVIEHGEMTHFRRAADEEGIKFMLSGTTDNVRLSYRRNSETFDRQFVIVGTTEDTHFLRSFHRRIWPIPCGKRVLDIAWLETNRDQLFAEAVAHYRDLARESNSGILPLDLRGEADTEFMAMQPDYLMPDADDAKAGMIRVWLNNPVPFSLSRPGSDRDDDVDAMFDDDDNLVLRDLTCACELFEKALGNDLAKYSQRDAQAMGKVMTLLEGEWENAPMARCGKYGRQRTYRRIRKPGSDL